MPNSVIMSGEAEKYVRERWENVDHSAGIYDAPDDGLCLFAPCQGWQAARAFTVARERRIAEVEQELKFLQKVETYGSFDAAIWQPTRLRILTREQAALEDLKRGLKEQP